MQLLAFGECTARRPRRALENGACPVALRGLTIPGVSRLKVQRGSEHVGIR